MTPIETAVVIVVPMLVIGYSVLFRIVSIQHETIKHLTSCVKELQDQQADYLRRESPVIIHCLRLTMEAAVRREDYEEAARCMRVMREYSLLTKE